MTDLYYNILDPERGFHMATNVVLVLGVVVIRFSMY